MKKLYVGNLSFQATEQDISNWFKQAGATEANVSLVKDRETGQARGFAFVEINNDEEAARVIQSLNGQDFMGRNVVVNEAKPREGGGGVGSGWEAPGHALPGDVDLQLDPLEATGDLRPA